MIRVQVGIVLHVECCANGQGGRIEIKDAPSIQIHIISTNRMRIRSAATWRDKYNGGRIIVELGNIDH